MEYETFSDRLHSCYDIHTFKKTTHYLYEYIYTLFWREKTSFIQIVTVHSTKKQQSSILLCGLWDTTIRLSSTKISKTSTSTVFQQHIEIPLPKNAVGGDHLRFRDSGFFNSWRYLGKKRLVNGKNKAGKNTWKLQTYTHMLQKNGGSSLKPWRWQTYQ